MNKVIGIPINFPANNSKKFLGIRFLSAYRDKNVGARITNLGAAIGRLLAGPPMSEQEKFNRTVAEARARSFEGLASAWFKPR